MRNRDTSVHNPECISAANAEKTRSHKETGYRETIGEQMSRRVPGAPSFAYFAKGGRPRTPTVRLPAGDPGLMHRLSSCGCPRSLAFGDRGGGAELPVAHSLEQLPASLAFHASQGYSNFESD